jgi:prepilin-type N-terminal cleavage/methylation domain-containing protein
MRKSFTLIELLVVIAIIAILAAILFPVFAQAKLAARSAYDLRGDNLPSSAYEIYSSEDDHLKSPGSVTYELNHWTASIEWWTPIFVYFTKSSIENSGYAKQKGLRIGRATKAARIRNARQLCATDVFTQLPFWKHKTPIAFGGSRTKRTKRFRLSLGSTQVTRLLADGNTYDTISSSSGVKWSGSTSKLADRTSTKIRYLARKYSRQFRAHVFTLTRPCPRGGMPPLAFA